MVRKKIDANYDRQQFKLLVSEMFFLKMEKNRRKTSLAETKWGVEIGRLMTVHRLARENKALLKKTGLLVSQSENNIATS